MVMDLKKTLQFWEVEILSVRNFWQTKCLKNVNWKLRTLTLLKRQYFGVWTYESHTSFAYKLAWRKLTQKCTKLLTIFFAEQFFWKIMRAEFHNSYFTSKNIPWNQLTYTILPWIQIRIKQSDDLLRNKIAS